MITLRSRSSGTRASMPLRNLPSGIARLERAVGVAADRSKRNRFDTTDFLDALSLWAALVGWRLGKLLSGCHPRKRRRPSQIRRRETHLDYRRTCHYFPLRREGRMPPPNLYARVRILLLPLHARPRVRRAPGLPCALSVLRANEMQNSGHSVPRE
jgi:hypothetical protein